MKSLARFRKNTSGATLVEYTLVFLMLMVLSFGIIEFGLSLAGPPFFVQPNISRFNFSLGPNQTTL